jgi:hypothetical protein
MPEPTTKHSRLLLLEFLRRLADKCASSRALNRLSLVRWFATETDRLGRSTVHATRAGSIKALSSFDHLQSSCHRKRCRMTPWNQSTHTFTCSPMIRSSGARPRQSPPILRTGMSAPFPPQHFSSTRISFKLHTLTEPCSMRRQSPEVCL